MGDHPAAEVATSVVATLAVAATSREGSPPPVGEGGSRGPAVTDEARPTGVARPAGGQDARRQRAAFPHTSATGVSPRPARRAQAGTVLALSFTREGPYPPPPCGRRGGHTGTSSASHGAPPLLSAGAMSPAGASLKAAAPPRAGWMGPRALCAASGSTWSPGCASLGTGCKLAPHGTCRGPSCASTFGQRPPWCRMRDHLGTGPRRRRRRRSAYRGLLPSL